MRKQWSEQTRRYAGIAPLSITYTNEPISAPSNVLVGALSWQEVSLPIPESGLNFDRDAFYREIGLRLQFLRKAHGKKQKDMAVALTMPRATYANLERGRQRIPVDALWRAAVVLRVPLDQLVPEPIADGFGSARPDILRYRLPPDVELLRGLSSA